MKNVELKNKLVKNPFPNNCSSILALLEEKKRPTCSNFRKLRTNSTLHVLTQIVQLLEIEDKDLWLSQLKKWHP